MRIESFTCAGDAARRKQPKGPVHVELRLWPRLREFAMSMANHRVSRIPLRSRRNIAVPLITRLPRTLRSLALSLPVLMHSILPAQGQDKALVEAARKEGKVTI